MQEYTKRKQEHAGREAGWLSQAEKAGSIPNSSMEAIMAGRARASSEMMGHRQDLAPSLNAKMAKAFGMDLSNVQLYRSEAMSGTETQGLASGNKIVLSSDIDLNTTAGQAVLGHEISHVHAQNQGIGMGRSGLYQNAGLEHQADMEGMRAARGQSILGDSSGMDMGLGMGGIGGLTPLGAGMSASAGAPMQAKKGGKKGGTKDSGLGRSSMNSNNHCREVESPLKNEEGESKQRLAKWMMGPDGRSFPMGTKDGLARQLFKNHPSMLKIGGMDVMPDIWNMDNWGGLEDFKG